MPAPRPQRARPATRRPDPSPQPAALVWTGALDDGRLTLVDIRQAPDLASIQVGDLAGVVEVLEGGAVRGATAPALVAAYGLVLAAIPVGVAKPGKRASQLRSTVVKAIKALLAAAPDLPAVRYALGRCRDCFDRHEFHLTAIEMCARLLMEAKRIHREDEQLCLRLAENGAEVVGKGSILLHGYGGVLASGGQGTALYVLREARRRGVKVDVVVGEARPLGDGARLALPELEAAGVPACLACDSEAAVLMACGSISAVIVAADAVAGNGDVAGPVGTYGLSCLAKLHDVPLIVVAPFTACDTAVADGAALGALDVTPAALVTALVTDRGVLRDLSPKAIRLALADNDTVPAV
jgi:methylthioribose-1-phosphate isomerase